MKLSLTYKFKDLGLLMLKVLVISTALVFIYIQIQEKSNINNSDLIRLCKEKATYTSIGILVLFTSLNWFFEGLKWQKLVSYIQKITLHESLKQTFSGMTFAAFTPNGIGDYGAKILYYPKKNISAILILNLLANGIQLVFTCIFGIIAILVYLISKNSFSLFIYSIYGLALILSILSVLYYFRNYTILGYSIKGLFIKIKHIPYTIHKANTLYGLVRYIIFSHHYYYIFLLLNIKIAYLDFIQTICMMYFFASLIPNFQFFDVAVKGSIGMYLFGMLGVDSGLFITAATIIWICNTIIPSIIGSYYVLQYKYQW